MDSSKAGICAEGQTAAEAARAKCWNLGRLKVLPQESACEPRWNGTTFTGGTAQAWCQSPAMAKKASGSSDPERGSVLQGAARSAVQKPEHPEGRIPFRERPAVGGRSPGRVRGGCLGGQLNTECWHTSWGEDKMCTGEGEAVVTRGYTDGLVK